MPVCLERVRDKSEIESSKEGERVKYRGRESSCLYDLSEFVIRLVHLAQV